MAKKKGDRARLSPTDKEWIYQTFLVLNNKTQTAKRCNVAIATVQKVIKELEGRKKDSEQYPAAREARAEVAAKLAGKMHVKVNTLMESITDEDIESGRIPMRDKDGNLTGYKYYGPSLLQKATSIGIITDKANVLQGYEKAMLQDVNDGKLMLPQDINGLIGAIQSKIKSLTMLNVRFEEDNQDLVTDAGRVMAEAEVIDSEQPKVLSFDEFDNPS